MLWWASDVSSELSVSEKRSSTQPQQAPQELLVASIGRQFYTICANYGSTTCWGTPPQLSEKADTWRQPFGHVVALDS